MSLPGTQDTLARTLLRSAIHPENIVIVNQSGSPVEIDWETEANTIAHAWYSGQEVDNTLCDILIGMVSPSGRLPISWPFKHTDLDFQKLSTRGLVQTNKYSIPKRFLLGIAGIFIMGSSRDIGSVMALDTQLSISPSLRYRRQPQGGISLWR
ncbi:glycosyl hydrolase family 3 C-terminal domain-containing protein [Talaromyces proteolyticus]|uniref:beta-glucosidase n=1 Tax=Talaromyces proteolyticus TaxID=1131652 RepID=A0AAD4PTC2_9EURO|nr:glycosyl hydrolase family 3 C-terminal domain-containing protein [Talaromyces proteolyticus]KAH8693060.1 glycosyl hydrolase family 3 C-terminal domain-containing protein [Talaromyces proteolyticus]